MLAINKIFKKLASDSSFWLPDFSNAIRPTNSRGEFIQDSETGYNKYCIWLSGYLATGKFKYSKYQIEIIKGLKKRKELSNPYLLADAGLSGYAFCNNTLGKFPKDFLANPDPSRLKSKALKEFKSYSDIKKFEGLSSEDNLQVGLVFEYISLQQNSLYDLIKGPRWLDIGWRALLKEALDPITRSTDKVKYVKQFIEEIAYLHSK